MKNLNGTLLQNDVCTEANDLNRKYFGEDLTCPVVFNNRFQTTEGRFMVNRRTKQMKIELNSHIYQEYGKDGDAVITDVIKHELCHYNLYVHGYPCGHNTYFYQLMARVHCRRHEPIPPFATLYLYRCQKCGYIDASMTYFYEDRYLHKTDRGHYTYIGTTVAKDFLNKRKQHAN